MIAVNDDTIDDTLKNTPGMCLVDIWASWCGPCKYVAPVLERFSELYNVPIYSVDADFNRVTLSKYGVLSVPTILVFKDGVLQYTSLGAKQFQAFLAEMAPWFDTPTDAVVASDV